MPDTPSDGVSSSTTTPTTDFPEELLNARVQFWTCLHDDHRHVTWRGDTATCDTCGLTSDMTREYADAVRARERRKVADEIRQTFREYHPTARDWLTLHGLTMLSGPGAVAMAIAAWIASREETPRSAPSREEAGVAP